MSEQQTTVPIIDPFGLPRPRRKVEHVTITDPSQPGVELLLSLRALDAVDLARVGGEVQRMMGLYVSGTEEMPAGPFPLVDGEPVEVSENLFAQAAMVAGMQAPPDDSRQPRVWNPEHMVAWSVTMPFGWRRLLTICDEINRTGKRAEGNSSGPPTER